MPSGAEGMRFVLPALLFVAMAAMAQAPAPPTQTLYKLVDKDGKVTYVDKVPRGFTGEVTPITMDTAATANAPPPAAPPARAVPPAAVGEAAGPTDSLSRKRALRDRLQANIDRARLKLDAARKALAGGEEPKEDEYQVIQQRFDIKRGETQGPRSNCAKDSSHVGKTVWRCATIVPGEAYYDRQKALEEAVRRAEAELEAAQREYQRNVD